MKSVFMAVLVSGLIVKGGLAANVETPVGASGLASSYGSITTTTNILAFAYTNTTGKAALGSVMLNSGYFTNKTATIKLVNQPGVTNLLASTDQLLVNLTNSWIYEASGMIPLEANGQLLFDVYFVTNTIATNTINWTVNQLIRN